MNRMSCSIVAIIPTCACGATSFNVAVTSGGSNAITVQSCSTVTYAVTGALSDTANEGLARVLFDLAFSGGPLPPADTPTSTPMSNFARPAGLTNPAGFGGSVQGGALEQVGGAQNTMNNDGTTIPYPNGTVITDVAHASTVLATGSFIAPQAPGTYTLTLTNLSAAVIRQGEQGTIFWKTDPILPGSISNLTINVQACPLYGDLVPNGVIDVDDILCVLDGFTSESACPAADIAPCPPNGNGIIDVDDILAILDTFIGAGPCSDCPTPCS